jgi:hypothetical protein
MTQEERNARILQAIAEYDEEIARTPGAARAALIEMGIYHENGTLRPEYGGQSEEAPKPA